MSEQQSIRDELINVMVMTRLSDFAGTDLRVIEQAVDQLLASPVIRRIQAEVLRDAARMIESLSSSDSPAARLDMYADAIEKGDDE